MYVCKPILFLIHLSILFNSDRYYTISIGYHIINMTSSKYLVLSLLLIVTLALGGWDVGSEGEDGDGLLINHAFAIPSINDISNAFFFYPDVGEVVISPVVTSNITGSDITYTWVRGVHSLPDSGTSDTSTLRFTVPPGSVDDIIYTLYAFDDAGYDDAFFYFYMTPAPIITIDGGDSPRNISAGDTFEAPSAECKPVGFIDPILIAPTSTIDTTTVSRQTITYTCLNSPWPDVTKTLTVNVGNPPPPSPLDISVTPSNRTVIEGDTITLTSSYTGGDGSSLTYSWSSRPDTADVFSFNNTKHTVFTAPPVDRDTTYSITLVVNDGTFRDSVTVPITVHSDPIPVVTIPSPNPLEIEYGGVYTVPAVTCRDNDDGPIRPIPDIDSINTRTPGDTRVTFTCTDSKNQAGAATLIVRVLAPAPLSVTASSSQSSVTEGDTIPLTSSHTGGDGSSLTYRWSSSPDTTSAFIDNSIPNPTFTAPEVDRDTYYTLTVEIGDDTHHGSATVRIQVLDDPAPVVHIPGPNPLVIEYGDVYTPPVVTCSDNDNASIIPIPSTDSINTRTPGDTRITFTCTDSKPQTGTSTLTVSVLPPPPLTVTISSDDSVYELDSIELTGSSSGGGDNSSLTYSWSSNPDTANVFSDARIQNPTFIAPAVDKNTRYTLTLQVSNSTHSGSSTAVITVLDDPAPDVHIPGPNPLFVDYNGSYTAPAVTCRDNDADTITPTSDTISIDTSTPGDTYVTFTCTDSKRQAGTDTLLVRVNQPENAPTVIITGDNPLHVPYDSTGRFTPPDVTCVDYSGATLTSPIGTVGMIDVNIPASQTPQQTITFTCRDDNGPGAQTLTVIVGEKPPAITVIDTSPVVERTGIFTPSDVVECSDDFDTDIRVTHKGFNIQAEGTYLVTFICTGPTTGLYAELDVNVTVTDTQLPEFLSAKYTPKTGALVITFNEDLDDAIANPLDFTIRSNGETSGGLTLTDATLTIQNQVITLTLTDEQKETFKTLSNPRLFIAANTISDTADTPNRITTEITDKFITVAKKKSSSSTPPPIVDLNALQDSQFNVDIPESVLDILESYDSSTPIESVMEGEIIFSFPFVTDGACYALGGKINTIHPYQIGLNQSTNIAFTAYSSSGIDHFVMFLNLDGDDTSYTSSDTYITYLNGRVTVVDPHNYIADATVTIEQDDEQSFQYTILTVIEFDGEMGLTNLVARIWNDNSRSTNIRILDALNIVSTPEQSELAEETTTTTTTELITTATPDVESTSDINNNNNNNADVLLSIKMWAGFDPQSISDSELLESIGLDYPGADIPDWVMTDLAVLVIGGDLTIDTFKIALVFVLDTIVG